MDHEVLQSVQDELQSYLREFHDCFPSEPSRTHMAAYVNGQLGPLRRKSVEPLALRAGIPPRTLQQFLGAHRWDESAKRARVRTIVARDHAHESATGVIGVIDETSFAKKGAKTREEAGGESMARSPRRSWKEGDSPFLRRRSLGNAPRRPSWVSEGGRRRVRSPAAEAARSANRRRIAAAGRALGEES